MKKTRVFSCILVVTMLFFALKVPALAAQVDETTNVPVQNSGNSFGIDATHALLGSQELVKNAKSVFLYECSSQTLMYAWNADVQSDPASMVKIMTALIAIEKGNLNDVAVVKEDVLATVPYDAVSADLVADELITLEELLYCMMTGSANDAAAVIADHVGGSVSAFVDMMNSRADDLGCTNTHFVNPHGIYEEGQYSSARDMCRILSEAMKNETFCTVFGTVKHRVPQTNKSEERPLSSGNYLINTADMPLYYDERVVGGRTGVAGDGTRCLAAAAEEKGMQLVSIILGSESIYEEDGYTIRSFGGYKETTSLLTAGFEGFKVSQILYPNQALIQVPVRNGTSQLILGPSTSASTVLAADVSLSDLQFHFSDEVYSLTAPIIKGDVIGSLEVWNGNVCIAKTDAYAMNSVDVVEQQQAADTESKGISGTVLTVVLFAILLLFSVIAAIRLRGNIAKLLISKRSRRYRSGRRRSR